MILVRLLLLLNVFFIFGNDIESARDVPVHPFITARPISETAEEAVRGPDPSGETVHGQEHTAIAARLLEVPVLSGKDLQLLGRVRQVLPTLKNQELLHRHGTREVSESGRLYAAVPAAWSNPVENRHIIYARYHLILCFSLAVILQFLHHQDGKKVRINTLFCFAVSKFLPDRHMKNKGGNTNGRIYHYCSPCRRICCSVYLDEEKRILNNSGSSRTAFLSVWEELF